MPEISLRTKLFVPLSRPNLVSRPHLLARLNHGLDPGCKVTLISTPPGFGKTTLLSQWIATLEHPVGWLSLDEADNDPDRFLTYFVAALEPIAPELVNLLQPYETSQPLAVRAVLVELIRELAEMPGPINLVLDDLHIVDNPKLHDSLLFFIQHLPPQMHLFVSSRTDPPWPLARMRARQELIELRTGDLRFAIEEASAFLNDSMALGLPAADITVLQTRTEGWIAGLQLASLSMRDKEDRQNFVTTFSGSHRFILDYLMDEVLARQLPATQEFLLKTSILSRLNGSLCDAVLVSDGSQATLMRLEQENLFLFPLDDERYWFRYHHLFADLLKKQLELSFPSEALSELHQRASQWYERAGLVEDAINHALAGKDFDRAAQLVEQQFYESINVNKEVSLVKWLDVLPVEKIRRRPWLSVMQAHIYQFNQRERVEDCLQWAELALQQVESSSPERGQPNPYSPAQIERLRGAIAVVRSNNQLVYGDSSQAIVQAKKALALLPEEDPWRAMVHLVLGGGYWAQGNRVASEGAFAAAVAACRKSEPPQQVGIVTALCYVGTQQEKKGLLQMAYETYQQALDLSLRPSGRQMPVANFPLIKAADLLREWNELERAKTIMEKGVELAAIHHQGQSDNLTNAYVFLARLHLALENYAGALEAIGQAEQVIGTAPVDRWLVTWFDECRLRYWLSRRMLGAAVSWAENSGLTVDGELSYHDDLHHINLARVLVAQGVQDPSGPYLPAVQMLLGRLRLAAERADWVHESIKILILQAVARWASGRRDAAAETLTQALTLAEPGGYMRMFIDEGRSVKEPLQVIVRSTNWSYAARLLEAMEEPGDSSDSAITTLRDPLSKRELEVLSLLDSQLSSTKIAKQLFISPNTVRFHMKNIYEKLQVHARAEAVEKAKSLNLI